MIGWSGSNLIEIGWINNTEDSMATQKYNIKKHANACWTQTWQIKNKGVPVDLTGIDFEMEFKKKRGPNEPKFLELKIGQGITIVDAVEGIIEVFIGVQDSMTTPSSFVYDLLMIQGTCSQVLVEGTLEISLGVTYAGS